MNLDNFLSLFLLLLSLNCIGQDTEVDTLKYYQIEDVIISATRTKRQLSSLPLPAQVVSKKEIESVNSVRLSDILNEQTGITLVTGHGSGGQGIQMQGFDSDYTLILIDGMPLIGRIAGNLDLNRISIGNVEQIEIVKGASSSLYGNEALGGVINVITSAPKNDFSGNVGYRGGTFNAHDISSNINYKKDKVGITSFVNRYSNQGYDLFPESAEKTVNPFANYTFNSKVSYDLSDHTNLNLSGRIFTEHLDYNTPDRTNEDLSNNVENEKIDWNAMAKISHKFSNRIKTDVEFYASQYNEVNKLTDSSNSTQTSRDYHHRFLRPEIRGTYQLNQTSNVIAGAGLTNERLKRKIFVNVPTFNSPYAYAQYDGHLTNRFNLIVGGRFDSHSEYQSKFSPKIALRYEITDNLSVKTSIGQGFKTPNFGQLYYDFTNSSVGYSVFGYNAVSTSIPELEAAGELINIVVPVSEFNDGLRPESSTSYNAGVNYNTGALQIGVNIYKNNIENLIDTRIVARKKNGQSVFSYYNVNKVFTQGIEFNFNYQIIKNLKISGGYQLLYAKDVAVIDKFKNKGYFVKLDPKEPSIKLNPDDYFGLYNRSRHMGNLKVFYSVPKWGLDANIRGTYRSKYGIQDSNANGALDKYDEYVNGYTIWDLAINKTFAKNYKIGFGIDNFLNFKDPKNISNISGRLLYGTINYNF